MSILKNNPYAKVKCKGHVKVNRIVVKGLCMQKAVEAVPAFWEKDVLFFLHLQKRGNKILLSRIILPDGQVNERAYYIWDAHPFWGPLDSFSQ